MHGKNFLFGSPSVTNQLALQIYGKLGKFLVVTIGLWLLK